MNIAQIIISILGCSIIFAIAFIVINDYRATARNCASSKVFKICKAKLSPANYARVENSIIALYDGEIKLELLESPADDYDDEQWVIRVVKKMQDKSVFKKIYNIDNCYDELNKTDT